MANEIEKINAIAIGDIEKVNSKTDSNIEKINSLEYTGQSFITATGGSITTSGNYKIHTFTSNGTFEVTSKGDSGIGDQIEYLCVAGGGGGGGGSDSGNNGSGGGGAGGMLTADEITASVTTYAITV